MIQLLVFLCFILVVGWLLKTVIGRVWQKMHHLVGIETGLPNPNPSHQLDYRPNQPLPSHLPNGEPLYEPRQWRTKHGKVPAMPQLAGINVDNLNRMPTEAVIILDRIHDKLTRYQAWRQQNTQSTAQGQTPTAWLTERQFVLDKLVNETISEAVNQYDQIARFHPHQLSQIIHDNMTASDMLIAVLQSVDGQIDELLGELYQQASQQLATTYRYVKSRTS